MSDDAAWKRLTRALERDDAEAMRACLDDLGSDPRDENELTPLHRAARHGAQRCVERLLDMGADPLAEDVGGTIPLEVALVLGRSEVAERLLDVPGVLEQCPRAMSWAIVSLKIDVVDLLRTRGVGLDEGALASLLHPGERDRPAERAEPRRLMLRALLDRGAPHDRPDTSGKLPLQLAAELSDPDLVAELLSRGAAVTGEVLISALFGLRLSMDAVQHAKGDPSGVRRAHAMVVSLLDAPGTDVDARDDDGGTALSYAVEDSLVDVAQELLSRGASVDLPPTDFEGRTPLSVAAEVGHRPMVELLLKHGADPRRADDGGRRPVEHAFDPSIKALLEDAANTSGS